MTQRCQVCLKKAAVWNDALRKYTCNECAIASVNATRQQQSGNATRQQQPTNVRVQYAPCPVCLYAATAGVQSPHPQNVNPHPIPTVADWVALNATIQQRNMAYTTQVIQQVSQASQARRAYTTTALTPRPRPRPSLFGTMLRHYVNGVTGGAAGFGGGGGIGYSSMFGGGGGGVDYSSMLGGGGGVDYSSMFGGGGGFDYSSMLGGGGFDFSGGGGFF